MSTLPKLEMLEKQLDSFVLSERMDALKQLAAESGVGRSAGVERINMHMHSFFSYNTFGYSPARIGWASAQAGLYAAALCDFDVLDGLEEFIGAGELLGLRTAVNLETRAFLKEYATVDITSPGEPGVTYIMGAGFTRRPAANSPQGVVLAEYRQHAQDRNVALVHRINAKVPEIALEYGSDVASLSPAACPTERHIIRAYRLKAQAVFKTPEATCAFWAKLMGKPEADIAKVLNDVPVMEDRIRAKLAKAGGIGYEKPTEKTFPPVSEFIRWVLACQAIPMVTWLDGTSKGEDNMRAMLECLQAQGACALNIIPDRNHAIADAAVRALKLKKLAEVVQAAEALNMPINIGTEMNKDGQPFVDDTGCDALRAYHGSFMRGARVMVGQTVLGRYADFSYVGPAAAAEFGSDVRKKRALFEAVGALPALTAPVAAKLSALGVAKALTAIRDSAQQNRWVVS